MPSPTADSLASRLRQMRQLNRAQRSVTEGSARALVMVAFAVPVVTMVIIAAVTVTVLLFAGSGLDGLGVAIGAIWLAVHQVPVTLSGVTIGILPMLPTLAIAVAAARMSASASGTERPASELAAVFCSAVGGPMLITALSLAVVMDGTSVMPVQSPSALMAFGYTLAIHGSAALLGIGWRRREELCDRFGVPPSVRRGVRCGVLAITALLTCAAGLVVVRLIIGWHVTGQLLADGNDFDGYLGLAALSVLYLPNAVVGAASVLVGSDFHIGTASVDLLDVRGGPLPPVPILGALPESAAGMLGLIGFLIPASIALVVALRCRDLDPLANVRSVAVASAVAATTMVVLCVMAGGELGEFGDAGVTLPTAGVFTLGWIAVVGLIVALIYGALPSTRAARRNGVDADFDDDYDLDYEDEYLTDDYEDPEDLDDEYGEFDDYEGEDWAEEDSGYTESRSTESDDVEWADGDEWEVVDGDEGAVPGPFDRTDQTTDARTTEVEYSSENR